MGYIPYSSLTKVYCFLLQETRAPNVMKMVKDFNRLALLVPTEILEEKTASARAKVITCYIQVKSSSIANTYIFNIKEHIE